MYSGAYHDDVIKWKHFSRYWPFVREVHRPPVNFPHTQRPVTRNFEVFFDLCLNKRLSEQSWGWWFETPSRPLWRHCDVLIVIINGENLTCYARISRLKEIMKLMVTFFFLVHFVWNTHIALYLVYNFLLSLHSVSACNEININWTL